MILQLRQEPELNREELLERYEITEDDIIEFAEKFNTHPAMIIGRLQKKKLILP